MQQQNLDLKLPPPPYPTPSNGGATPAPKLRVHLKIIRLLSVWVQTHSAFFVVCSHGDIKINTFFNALVLPSSSKNDLYIYTTLPSPNRLSVYYKQYFLERHISNSQSVYNLPKVE